SNTPYIAWPSGGRGGVFDAPVRALKLPGASKTPPRPPQSRCRLRAGTPGEADMQVSSRSCSLRYFQLPRYWEYLVEPIASSDAALCRMCEIESGYKSRDGEHVTVHIDDSNG